MSSRQPDSLRLQRLEKLLATVFPESPSGGGRGAMELVRAPGRVVLLGEHTDYNDGFALSVSIEMDCWIAYRRRTDGQVRIVSCQTGDGGSFWIDAVEPTRGRTAAASGAGAGAGAGASGGAGASVRPLAGFWPDAVRRPAEGNPPWVDLAAAMAWSLRESGLPLHGMDAVVDSTVPIGIGLGASAALELACGIALSGTERAVAAPILAALAQRAEREFLDGSASIKDHFASAAGREGKALLLDCRSLETKLVAMPHGLRLVVCDTGSHPSRDDKRFRDRHAECARAVALLSERVVGLTSLRDLDAATLKRHRHRLPGHLARRAEHVISENARVLDAAVALASSDLDDIARLFGASHASLRDGFEVSSPEVEAMIQVVSEVPGVVASRLIGPGLGGCTLHLVLDDAVPALVAAVTERYPARTGLTPAVYPTATADGAGKLLAAG
jgi:galactokinase